MDGGPATSSATADTEIVATTSINLISGLKRMRLRLLKTYIFMPKISRTDRHSVLAQLFMPYGQSWLIQSSLNHLRKVRREESKTRQEAELWRSTSMPVERELQVTYLTSNSINVTISASLKRTLPMM